MVRSCTELVDGQIYQGTKILNFLFDEWILVEGKMDFGKSTTVDLGSPG